MKRLGGAAGLLLTVAMVAGLSEGVASATTSGWHTVPTPRPSRTYLEAVSCSSPTACTAVGSASIGNGIVIISSGNSSSSDVAQSTSAGIIRVRSLRAAEQLVNRRLATAAAARLEAHRQYHGWAVAERWNGTSWTRQKLPAIPHTELADLDSIACPSVNECVAVGGYVGGKHDREYPLAEVWNGSTWRRVAMPAIDPEGVTCSSSTNCLATGEPVNGETLTLGQRLRPIAARWNGQKWTKTLLAPGPRNSFLDLSSISCPTTSACEAYGARVAIRPVKGGAELIDHTFAEGWNGARWSVQTTPTLRSVANDPSFSAALACASATRCIGTGNANGEHSSQQLVESWNGSRWSRQAWPGRRTTTINDVACVPDGTCTMVGDRAWAGGRKATTVAFGSTATTGWTAQRTPQVPDSQRALLGVTGTGNTWIAVGAKVFSALVEMRP